MDDILCKAQKRQNWKRIDKKGVIIIRIWDYRLLPYLPDLQFRGQLRELVAIMHDWRDKGKTNHLLINKVMEYEKRDLSSYAWFYFDEYAKRNGKHNDNLVKEFVNFAEGGRFNPYPFENWHKKEYLRMNMSNLAEKHFFGVGKSRITDAEWKRLCEGYRNITGEEYEI